MVRFRERWGDDGRVPLDRLDLELQVEMGAGPGRMNGGFFFFFDRELFFQLLRDCQVSWAAFPGRKGASRDSRELGSLTCVRAESPCCTEIFLADESEVTARSTDDGVRVGG